MDIRQLGLREDNRYQDVMKELQNRLGPVFSLEVLQSVFNPSVSEVIAEMFARMGRGGTLVDFVRVFVGTENLMKNRIDELEKEVADCETGLQDTQRKLESAQRSETLTEHGIMEGSVLTAEVHSLVLKTEHRSSMCVELTCEEKITKTKSAIVTKTGKWDESFTFQVKRGTGDLLVAVVESLPSGKRTIGQVAIPVKLLNDQLKHTSGFSLMGGESGELSLTLQWIWSKSEYLRSIAVQWNENLATGREELSHLQRQFAVLSNFGRDAQQFPFENIDGLVSKQVDKVLSATVGLDANMVLAVQLCTICLVICSTLAMIIRPDFPNVTLSGGAFVLHALGPRASKVQLKWYCMALFVSQLYDILFYLACLSVLFTQVRISSMDGERGLYQLSAAVSIMNNLVKVCAFIIFWKRAEAVTQSE